MKRLRILIVDDQAMFRDGVRLILSQHADFEILGEAGNGNEALKLIRHAAPDVVLMDLRMPEMGGVEATQRIRTEAPSVKVIILTTFEEDEEVFGALRAGASGFLLKDARSENLCDAIRMAARGETWLQPSVASKLVSEFGRLTQRPTPPDNEVLLELLTRREREVLRCLADGMANKEIAHRLMISEGTVKNHMSQVLGKLHVLDRTQAALRARELGLI